MPKGVLLIRPHDQANSLEQALADEKCHVYRQAVIETHNSPLAQADWQKLEQPYDAVVVISPSAALYFDQQLHSENKNWPDARYYCVGSGTAERLVPLTGQAVTYPAPEHTGEALIQLADLQQIENQRWLIITGQDGRTLIPDTLKQRGAIVDTFEVYKRTPTNPDLAGPYSEWSEQVGLIVVTSQQQLELFFNALEPLPCAQTWAQTRDWVVSSARLKEALAQSGVGPASIHVAENATHVALLRTIKKVPSTDNETPNIMTKNITTKTVDNANANDETKTMKSTPKRSVFATFFTVIVLLCVVTLGVGGYWAWAQQEAFRAQTNAQLTELNERIEATNTSQEALAGSVFSDLESQLNTRLDTLQQERETRAREERQQNEQARQAMREEFEQHTADLEQIRADVDAANLRVSEDLFLVEARDLTMAAGRKLWLEYDRRTAISLLERAEQILADAGQTHLMPIRQQLRNDIELLEGVEETDLDSLAMRVNAVRQQLRSLPFNAEEFNTSSETDADISSDFADWRNNLAKAWANFTDDFIRIQRTEMLPELQLGQEQQTLLLSQLELQLQIAQQALLQRQTINYREALDQAIEWIEAYFATERNAVQRVLSELSELRDVDLDPSYPTRLLSEAMLRDAVDELLEGSN